MRCWAAVILAALRWKISDSILLTMGVGAQLV